MQQKAIRIQILNCNVEGAQAAEKYCRGWQRQAAVGEVGRKEYFAFGSYLQISGMTW